MPTNCLHAIPDPVVRLDRDLRYLAVNRAAAEAAGLEPEALLGRCHLELSPDPSTDEPLRRGVHRAFDTGELQTAELRYDFGDAVRWYEARIAPEHDAAGEVTSVVVVARDITHLKRVEHDLGERVKELRCLYACSTALADTSEGLGEALRRVVDAMPDGWQFPDLAVARVRVRELDLCSPRYQQTERVQMAPVVAGAESVGFVELGYLEPRPFIPEENELISAIATRIGETVERLDVQRELAQRSAHFHALVAASTDMIGILAEDATIRYLSPGAAALLGGEPDSFVGTNAMALVHPDDREQVAEALARALAEPGGLARATFRLRRTDGSYITVETTGRNMLHEPSVRGLVTSTRDLTERRALETQLHQAQKMEAVGRLAGGIAHDFNNVLTIIEASADLLGESFADGDLRLEDVDEITQAAKRAGIQTRQIPASRDEFLSAIDALNNSTCDVVLMIPDTAVYNSAAIRRLLVWGARRRSAVVTFSTKLVRAGAFGGNFVDGGEVGKTAAALVESVVRGEGPSATRIHYIDNEVMALNERIAETIGTTIDKSRLTGRLIRFAEDE